MTNKHSLIVSTKVDNETGGQRAEEEEEEEAN
jgi:hypothetical protein